jgi:1-phosphatidylinositol-4-phosphate 5-kinase
VAELRELSDSAFTRTIDFALPSGTDLWHFQDFAPEVFANIRAHFNVDPLAYRYALGSDRIIGNLLLGNLTALATVGSSGRSGSCFFMTQDGKYFVKTLPIEEEALFRRILRSYYNHVVSNPNTLLTRFYGLHRIRKGNNRDLCLVVMANLFGNPELKMHEIYDLKGSTVNRDVSVDKDDLSVIARKDNNFSRTIRMGSLLKAKLLEQLELDCRFLEAFGICDYSLLVGFHFAPPPITATELADRDLNNEMSIFRQYRCGISCTTDEHAVASATVNAPISTPLVHAGDASGSDAAREIYFIGVIDILTCYDIKKKTEHHLKSFIYNRKEISAVPPDDYRMRFLKYVTSIVS